MIDVLVIRKNRTMKRKKVSEKADKFEFEKGHYYIQPEKVIFKKMFLFAKPFLLYFEGIPIPIGIEEIQTDVKGKMKGDLTKSDMAKADMNILINAQNIHDLVSTDVLTVLTKKTLSPFEWILLALLVLTFLVSCAGVI